MASPGVWETAQAAGIDLNAEQWRAGGAAGGGHFYVCMFLTNRAVKLPSCRQTSRQKRQETTSETAARTRLSTKLKQLLGSLCWKRLRTEYRETCSCYLSSKILKEMWLASLKALDCIIKYLAASSFSSFTGNTLQFLPNWWIIHAKIEKQY